MNEVNDMNMYHQPNMAPMPKKTDVGLIFGIISIIMVLVCMVAVIYCISLLNNANEEIDDLKAEINSYEKDIDYLYEQTYENMELWKSQSEFNENAVKLFKLLGQIMG